MDSNKEDAFLKAIISGRKWLVEKHLLLSNIDIHMHNEEPLRLAVLYGRRNITEFLLNRGACPNKTGAGSKLPIVLACRRGSPGIAKVLLSHGARPDEEAILEAIANMRTSCIKALLEAHCDISFRNHEPIFRAYYAGARHIMTLLLQYGADIDAREGELLVDSSSRGNLDTVQFLIDKGADPNIRDGEAIRQAARNCHASVVEILLRGGCNENYLADLTLDYFTRQVVVMWKQQNRIPRLRRAIIESFDKDTFKWQGLCRKLGNDNLPLVQQQARLFQITNVTHQSKRSLCKELAVVTEPQMQNEKNLEDVDLYGNPLCTLPKWKLYKMHGRIYNVFDLFRLIRKGYTTCPYTRLPMPVQDIEKRRRWLDRVLTRTTCNDFNLIEQVQEMPILDRAAELKSILFNEVWSKLSYPPSIDIVLHATDPLINDMLRKLYIVANDITVYPMLTGMRKWRIYQESGSVKRELFIMLLVDILALDDENLSIRTQTLNILFQHYDDEGNIRQDGDDLLSFMIEDVIQEDDDDFHF